MQRQTLECGFAVLLTIALVMSGVAIVTTTYQSRQLFSELEELKREQDRLQLDWRRLRIEEGALAAHAHIDAIARDELGLIEPDERRRFVEPQP